MKSCLSPVIIIKVTMLLLMSSLAHGQQSAYTSNDFSRLDKLVGTWRTENRSVVLYEHWLKKSKHQLEGKSYKIVRNDTVILERVRLELEGVRIVYAVSVDGDKDGKETLFYLLEIKGDDYIFEDKRHDFPQRVVYNMEAGNELLAYIEGEIAGKSKRSAYAYVRVPDKK